MTGAFVGIDISESASTRSRSIKAITDFECPVDPSTPDKLIDELKRLKPRLIALGASRTGIGDSDRGSFAFTLVCRRSSSLRPLFASSRKRNAPMPAGAEMLAGSLQVRTRKPRPSPCTANQIKALLDRRDQLLEMLDE